MKRRKFSGRGRYKRSNYKKRLVGGAARAARSSYTNTPMCRDLGSIWPSCLITKLRFHAVVPADYRTGSSAMTGTANQGTSYSSFFNFWPNYSTGGTPNPAGPLVAATYGGTAATACPTVTGFTPPTAEAMGVDKLLAEGKVGSVTGPYSRCCVLAANYKYTITAYHALSQGSLVPMPITLPSQQFLHPMCSKDQIITVPTTQSTADSMWNQPDVQRKYVTRSTQGVMAVQNAGTTLVMPNLPATTCIWRGKIWPHKLLDKTFTDYVSDDSSFGTYNSMPTNFVGHQLAGFFSANGDTTNYVSPDDAVLHINVVFTCLFKDIAGVQT